MSTISVLLADDHTIVLEGIKAVVAQNPQIRIVAEVGNGEDVLAAIPRVHPDVVVLDINMPKMDGLTCARKVKALFPTVRIIMLTMYSQKSFVEEIIRIGVDGCLLKNHTGLELNDAIQRVYGGRSYFDFIQTLNPSTDTESQPLSPREHEIVQLLAEGMTSQGIADKLFIAEHTVKTHRKNILRKAGVHTTAELIQYALTHGLI